MGGPRAQIVGFISYEGDEPVAARAHGFEEVAEVGDAILSLGKEEIVLMERDLTTS